MGRYFLSKLMNSPGKTKAKNVDIFFLKNSNLIFFSFNIYIFFYGQRWVLQLVTTNLYKYMTPYI